MARGSRDMDACQINPDIVCCHTVIARDASHLREMMAWCTDDSREGWYRCQAPAYDRSMRGMRILMDQSGRVLAANQVMFGFSDPDVAFEFKVRWG